MITMKTVNNDLTDNDNDNDHDDNDRILIVSNGGSRYSDKGGGGGVCGGASGLSLV